MRCSSVVVLARVSCGATGAEDSVAGAAAGSSSVEGVVSTVGAVAGVEILFSASRGMSWLTTSICEDHGRELGLMTGFGATGGGFFCLIRED